MTLRAGALTLALVLARLIAAGHAYADGAASEAVGRGQPEDPLALTPETLRMLSAELEDARSGRRRAAIVQLRALGHEALAGLSVHLRELARAGVDGPMLAPKLAQLRRLRRGRRLAGVTSDEHLALALDQDRSVAMAHAVALTSVSHALIAQHSREATDVLVGGLFRLAPSALRGEAVRARKQLGSLLGPAYLRYAATSDPAMRRLCRAALAALGMRTPREAFMRVDAIVLPDLLRAYGAARALEALPWIVAHLGDPRPSVHLAARDASSSLGAVAVPVLRTRFLQLAHTQPDEAWDGPRLLAEIEARTFTSAEHAAKASLVAAESALASDARREAGRHLDLALQQLHSDTLRPRIAAAYLSLGAQHWSASDAHAALHAYRRALRISPGHEAATTARARVLELEAELRLHDGVADVHTLRQAAALDPGLARASDLLHELSGLRAEHAHAHRRRAGLAAAALFALSAALLLRDARQRRARTHLQRTGRG